MIRAYEPEDALPTLQLFTRSVREVARREEAVDLAEWGARMAALRPSVCILDDTLAGFSDVQADGYVSMLFVEPTMTRRGVASALLASHLSVVPEDLWTIASITARGFFERHGFEVESEQTVFLRGQEFTNYRMVLSRSSPDSRAHRS